MTQSQSDTHSMQAEIAETPLLKPVQAAESKSVKDDSTPVRKKKSFRGTRPYLPYPLSIKSLPARRVFGREMFRSLGALFTIDVVLAVVADQKMSTTLMDVVRGKIDKLKAEMSADMAQVDELMTSCGIVEEVRYSDPFEAEVRVYSPEARVVLNLLSEMDKLIRKVDVLWLSGEMDSSNRSNINFQWQNKLIKLGRSIVNDARRAMKAAHSKGKAEEIAALLKEYAVTDDDSDVKDPQTLASLLGKSDAEHKKLDDEYLATVNA